MNDLKRIPKSDIISPFLEGTNIQFAWDSTSLGYIKQCPRLYQYIMIDGWGEGDESIHLRFGDEYHTALQNYDLSRALGKDHDEAVKETLVSALKRTWGWEVDETARAGKYKNRRSLIRTVLWYLDKFEEDNAETYILADGSPAVELSFRFELDWGPRDGLSPEGEPLKYQPYLLCGHLDRVVKFNEELFVMDHKTTTTTPSDYYFNQFEPNNQMSLYTLASKIVLHSPIKGVIIGAAQLMVDISRFVRGFTYRTEDQLNEWLKDLGYWLALAKGYAEANYWPQNDTACDKYGGCRFRNVCSKSPGVRDSYLRASFTKLKPEDRWNPLKPR